MGPSVTLGDSIATPLIFGLLVRSVGTSSLASCDCCGSNCVSSSCSVPLASFGPTITSRIVRAGLGTSRSGMGGMSTPFHLLSGPFRKSIVVERVDVSRVAFTDVSSAPALSGGTGRSAGGGPGGGLGYSIPRTSSCTRIICSVDFGFASSSGRQSGEMESPGSKSTRFAVCTQSAVKTTEPGFWTH